MTNRSVTHLLDKTKAMPDMNRIPNIQMVHQFGKVVGISIKIIAVPGLAGLAMSAAIVRDAAIAARSKEKHHSGQPWLNTTGWPVPVLVVNRGAVSGSPRGRDYFDVRLQNQPLAPLIREAR